MNRKVRIKQHDITDCGAACLASVSAYYRLKLPIARIRQYANTDQKGTNVLGLIEAAQRLGFQAKGVKGNADSLAKIPKPAIAHVIVKSGHATGLHHYVVIYEVNKTHLWFMDPGDGKIHKKTIADFLIEWTGVLLLLLPGDDFQTGNRKTSIFQRFWVLFKPHRTVMLQALVGAIAYTILGLGTSVYIQKITDYVWVGGNTNLLNLLSVSMIAILILQALIGSIKSVFALKTGQQIDAQLILGYYKHLLKLPQQFFDTMRVGEITSRINDAVKIRVFINDVALNLVVDVFIILFSFGLMFTYYWKLALLMLVIIPIYVLLYVVSNQINKKQLRKLMEDSAELEAQLVESLNTMPTIKRFGLEVYANLKTETRFVSLLRTIFRSSMSGLYIGNIMGLFTSIFTIVLLWVGSYYVINRDLTPGELMSFYSLIGYFTGPASGLIGMNRTIQDALIAAERLFEIMDLEREETENKVSLSPELIGDITFNNVSFRYGSRVQVFSGLSLGIPKGKVTAFVGESGSGKSTLMSLLQNLYPLQSGSIQIGDFDIKHIHPESLRQMVGVVPQKIDLFSGTFIENIAIGHYTPDMQRVLAVSQALGITDFIEKIPNGFNASIGENGSNLSGGQRQRLGIARALYRKPEILILDEATSALDSHSEQYVQHCIEQLRQAQKTVIIIAHRLSTVRNADQIVVLDQGRLAEQGTHQHLINHQGLYARLWQQQVGQGISY